MKILTSLRAKLVRVKYYSCITVASYIYIWEISLLLFHINNTHKTFHVSQVHENAITAFKLYISRKSNLQV